MSLLNGDRWEPAADVDDPAVPAALTKLEAPAQQVGARRVRM